MSYLLQTIVEFQIEYRIKVTLDFMRSRKKEKKKIEVRCRGSMTIPLSGTRSVWREARTHGCRAADRQSQAASLLAQRGRDIPPLRMALCRIKVSTIHFSIICFLFYNLSRIILILLCNNI